MGTRNTHNSNIGWACFASHSSYNNWILTLSFYDMWIPNASHFSCSPVRLNTFLFFLVWSMPPVSTHDVCVLLQKNYTKSSISYQFHKKSFHNNHFMSSIHYWRSGVKSESSEHKPCSFSIIFLLLSPFLLGHSLQDFSHSFKHVLLYFAVHFCPPWLLPTSLST